MAELKGAVGELRFTLEVTRKETGKTETVEMIGYLDPAMLAELVAPKPKVHGATGAMVGPESTLSVGE